MKYFVIALGLAMAAVGGQAVWTGYDIVEIERGWSAVIAGSTVFASGLITVAIGFLMWRVDALRRAVLSLRRDEERLPKAVEIPLAAADVSTPVAASAPRASEPARAAPEIPAVPPMPAPVALPPVAAPPVVAQPVAPVPVAVRPVAPLSVAPPPSFLARSNIAPLPLRGERVNRSSPPVVAADESLQLEPETGTKSLPPLSTAAVATAAGSSPQSTEPVVKGPIILPSRLDRVVMPKRRSNGGRGPSSLDEGAGESTTSAAPPRSLPFSRGVWPERPFLQTARRPSTRAAALPLEASPGQSEEAPARPQVGMHDWLERALAGDEDAGQPNVAWAVDRPDLEATETSSSEQEAAAASEVTPAADPPPEASPALDPAVTPVARYEAHGTTYVMFTDGSIEAESNTGHYHFASIVELKQFIEQSQH